MPIEIYTFEDNHGNAAGCFSPQGPAEASDYAREHGLRVIRNTFAWAGCEVLADFTRAVEEDINHDLNELRKEVADELFMFFDLGEDDVKDTSGWEDDGNEWSMKVFLERGDQPSEKKTFVVQFVPGTTDVLTQELR
ncbi:MAG: hypothetical protein E6G97_17790 [Alphaproteobacteria bacterium]|nr:MAG: hypothetical protein E6G97_17790 [Alphaproteobacteria bacterium]